MHHQDAFIFRGSKSKRAILEKARSDREAEDKARDDEKRIEEREEKRDE